MIKQIGFALLLLVGMVSVASAAVNTIWGAEGTAAYLYNSSGTLLDPENVSYRIEMVIDVNGDTDMSGLMGGSIGLTGDANGWDSYTHASALDDIVIDARSWLWTGAAGQGYISDAGTAVADAYTGTEFYFRWFDSVSQSSATEAGIIYGSGGVGNLSGWTVGPLAPAPAEPSRQLDYLAADSLGTDYTAGAPAGWGTIAPVPEPGTMALFALGLATLGVSRRRRKVQA